MYMKQGQSPGTGLFPVTGRELREKAGSGLWEVRPKERDYALLNDPEVKETNRYGQRIDLVDLTENRAPVNRSLGINGSQEVGCNVNRNKQHGFYFNADNCIGCHACESACAEKNETPDYLAFRSVGYLEGGKYPDFQRLNISMACNHCDDPVCLKGCPTGAYTKHAEYGAVLQDPDTCFGCGYCTWVCPYNAPQLDPVEGQVSKCNMCVDRLEVGLKPACVSACVGNALDFGVIENIPDNRIQAEASIPGFPDPEITHPNIRFQQKNPLPAELKRTDSTPVLYRRVSTGEYEPALDPDNQSRPEWNLSRLSSHENPLLIFTLATQASMGAFLVTFLGVQFNFAPVSDIRETLSFLLLTGFCLVLVAVGLFVSTTHLGKPVRFYRGFNNLRYSPVCREGLGVAIYLTMLGIYLIVESLSNAGLHSLIGTTEPAIAGWIDKESRDLLSNLAGWLAVISSFAGLYYMNRCYRIKARPFWDHWQVLTSFFGNSLSIGAFLTILFILPLASQQAAVPDVLGLLMLAGVMIESVGLLVHQRDMIHGKNEGAASHQVQITTFGRAYQFRNILLGLTMGGAALLLLPVATAEIDPEIRNGAWLVLGAMTITTSIVGRALFYVVVIPTTMPGAFFWRNRGFEEHARDTGLAEMPQAGILPYR